MKRFNLDEFIQFIILLAFTMFFYYLLSTGKIKLFISPKMLKYMIFSLIGFGILSLYQCTKIFTIPNRKAIDKSHMILFITLVIGFVAAQNGLNLNIIEKKNVNITNTTPTQKIVDNIVKTPIEKQDMEDNESIIEFTDDNYFEKLGRISDNIESYKGKKVIISGFVFKDKDFKADEFVVARLMMSCCAADSQVVGLMSKWSNTGELESEVWVKIEGTIGSTLLKDNETGTEIYSPVIIVNKVEKIQKPENIYVYPK